MAKLSKEEIEFAADKLRTNFGIKPGSVVFTNLKSVASNGMSRHISTHIVPKRDDIRDVTHWVSQVLGYRRSPKTDGLVVGGTGMDMGFHVVYSLSRALFPDGFECVGAGCPSNDHFNGDTSTHHRDGGYALKHRWL